MMNDVRSIGIRPATGEDYAALLPLFLGLREFSRAGHPDPGDDFSAVLAASRDYLREILVRGPECRTFVAVSDDGVGGYLVAVVHPPNPLTSSGAFVSGSIDELFVGEAWRGSGAAGRLLDAAETWLREQGAMTVSVGAYAWNTAAIAWYERHGFAPSSVTLMKRL
jgi:GNAT superfamily N-acetyltransferase